MIEALANTLLVIILQYINALNQHIVHLKLTQCYNDIAIKNVLFKKIFLEV